MVVTIVEGTTSLENPKGKNLADVWNICGACVDEMALLGYGMIRRSEFCDFCGTRTLCYIPVGYKVFKIDGVKMKVNNRTRAEAVREKKEVLEPVKPKSRMESYDGELLPLE